MSAVIDRTTLRKQLLSNGFEPLPLAGKACYVPGWTACEIDEAFIERFRRNGGWDNTGIRCGQVVGIDIDCDDEALADVVDGVVESVLGPTDWCRFGREPRRILLYWCEDGTRKRRTGRYGGQQVEVLGAGCQFAAYGRHPTANVAYRWLDGHEPARCTIDDLPAITAAQLTELIATLEALLAGTGKPLESAGAVLGETPQHDYCLTDDMTFDVEGRGMLTVAQLREALPAKDGWICNLTAIRPDSDSKGGLARRAHDGSVMVADFVTGVTYFEAETVPADDMAALAAAIATGAQNAFGGVFAAPPSNALADLIAGYVYVASDDTVRKLTKPSHGTRFANFSKQHRSFISTGPKSKQLLANYWLENGAVTCSHPALLPDRSERVVNVDGVNVLNTYVPPTFPAEGGSIELFLDFVNGLIPLAKEQALLLDWIAFKVQHPGARMHALVLVCEEFGSGRGSLMKVFERLIGAAYTTHTTLSHVFGRTYQSQYNDWLADALLVTVPEAQDTTEVAHDWSARRKAYEALKEAVETGSGAQMVRRKGSANTTAQLYCSLVISTNHADALAIDANDRRMLVLSGGVVRSPEFYRRLHAWMDVAENIGALARWLKGRSVSYDPYGLPPMTNGKARMLAASESDIDSAYLMLLEEAPGDVITVPQWLGWLRWCKAAMDIELPDNYKRVAERVIGQRARRFLPQEPRWKLRVGDALVRPWVIRNFERWQNDAASLEEMRREVIKNGDPTQKIPKLKGPPW